MTIAVAAPRAGRVCPADYGYAPEVFDRRPDFECPVLYVVGGLYGNLQALDQIERLAAAESSAATIVFNGDFHWFDAEPSWFSAIDARVARHRALRGNVESEVARAQDIGAGCGCTYPAGVDDGVVERSNDILDALRSIAPRAERERLARLPMHFVANVGPLRIGIVHGDACSLAGWRFAYDALGRESLDGWLTEVRRASQIDVFASTHTCLAALRDLNLAAGRMTVVNNGAAGMANFAGSSFGVVTRIAASQCPHQPLYGIMRDGIHIDAVAVEYDVSAFLDRFLSRWPKGSAAHVSYFDRIVSGPDHDIARALA
jgi:hypothetical protein